MDSKPIDIYAEKEIKLKELQAQEEKVEGLQLDHAEKEIKLKELQAQEEKLKGLQVDIYSEKETKLKELQAQEEKLKKLQADLAKLNTKIENNEPISDEDTKFVSQLGWLSAVSVTIAAIATSLL